MSAGEKPRSLTLWPLLALLLILAGLLFGGLEWYERRKFDRLHDELQSLLYPLEEMRLSIDPDGALKIVKGGDTGLPIRVGMAASEEENPRWLWWSVEARSDFRSTGSIGFLVELSQTRRVLLLSPRIRIAPLGSYPPAFAAYVDDLFKSRGIPYEPTSYGKVMSK